jgi:hypothetical protein
MQEWIFEHTIECGVSVQFAWNFWTNVSNWKLDTDVDSIELQGEFAVGSRGVTNSKSSGRIEWQITELVQERRVVLEFPAPGAVARFVWTFEGVDGRARITQRASLCGEQMAKYAESIGPALQLGIPEGMRKLCEAMEAAARS